MNIPQFIHFSFDGHLGYSQIGAIMNKAIINILVYIFHKYMLFAYF